MRGRQKSVDALFLAETLASRLCHDLSGEVNALAGAVEEMRDSACPDRDAIELANDACEALVRRLRLARAAWGGLGGPMGMEEWRTIVDFMPRRGVTLALDGVSEAGFFAPAAARLTLNVLLLATESLPAGGVVEVSGKPERDLLVRIRGPRAAWPAGMAGMMADPAEAVDHLRRIDAMAAARTLQAALTALIAHATGQRISFLLGPHAEDAPPLFVALVPVP